mgnify:CR=1 FL=1
MSEGSSNFFQLAGMAESMLGELFQGSFEDPRIGKPVKLGANAAKDPGGFGPAILEFLDNETKKDVLNPLHQMMIDDARETTRKIFLQRWPDDPERAERESQRYSLTYLTVRGMQYARGDHAALKKMSKYLDHLGYDSYSLGPSADRRRKCLVTMAGEMYKQSVGLSLASPFQGESVDDNVSAMLSMADAGSFKHLLHEPGVFDSKGELTDMGKVRVSQTMSSAGRSLYAMSRLTGQTSAMASLQVADKVLGPGALQMLADPSTATALTSLWQTADLSNTDGMSVLQMLDAYRQRYPKTSNPVTLIQKAKQQLVFSAVGRRYGTGDQSQWDSMVARMSAGTHESEFAYIANAGVAALVADKQQTAKAKGELLSDEAAYAQAAPEMQQMMLNTLSSPRLLVDRLNSVLKDTKLTRENAADFAASPPAMSFANNETTSTILMTRPSFMIYREMLKRSRWARKNFSKIIQEQGELTTDSIAAYLKNHGASVQDTGKINRHLDAVAESFIPDVGVGDKGTLLALVNTGSKMNERRRILREANNRGEYSADVRNERQFGGRMNAALNVAHGTGNVWEAAKAAVVGTGRTAPEGGRTALQPQNVLPTKPPNTATGGAPLPGSNTVPGNLPTNPQQYKAPNGPAMAAVAPSAPKPAPVEPINPLESLDPTFSKKPKGIPV